MTTIPTDRTCGSFAVGMLEWYRFTLGALATWRLTHLLNAEDGPGQVFVRIRRAAGEGVLGQLLDCFYCLSLWIAAPLALALGRTWPERLLLITGFSAAAILLERRAATVPDAPLPFYKEDEEVSHGMLRKEPSSSAEGDRDAGAGADAHDGQP